MSVSVNVQKRLVKVRNNLRAFKIAAQLNYGALSKPSEVPTASLDDTISGWYAPHETGAGFIWNRYLATFTRTDGVNMTPFVDFSFDWIIGGGGVATERAFNHSIYSVSDGSVTYAIELNDYCYTSTGSLTLSLIVQAVSSVAGNLTISKVW